MFGHAHALKHGNRTAFAAKPYCAVVRLLSFFLISVNMDRGTALTTGPANYVTRQTPAV